MTFSEPWWNKSFLFNADNFKDMLIIIKLTTLN